MYNEMCDLHVEKCTWQKNYVTSIIFLINTLCSILQITVFNPKNTVLNFIDYSCYDNGWVTLQMPQHQLRNGTNAITLNNEWYRNTKCLNTNKRMYRGIE